MLLNELSIGKQIWLTMLLLLWAIFLFGGFIYGRESHEHRIPRPARMASSLALALAGWSWWLFAPQVAKPYALWIALGMSLGLLGDLILAGYGRRGRDVPSGMLAFGLGHLCYIAGIIWLSRQLQATDLTIRATAVAVWLLIAFATWYKLIFHGREVGLLHKLALPYALLLASTAGFATGLALQITPFWSLALGAALFLFSDLVLAVQLFAGVRFRSIGDVIWLTYGPGQMFIVYATGVAIQQLVGA